MSERNAHSNLRNELIARAHVSRAISDGFDENAIVPTTVKWTGSAFESATVRRPAIHEIYCETEYRHSTELPVQKSFLNRRHPVRSEVVERVVGKLKARVFINTYVEEAELHDLADQHLPSMIGQSKQACFAFDFAAVVGISDAVRAILDELQDGRFVKHAKLRRDLIPVFEIGLLTSGYVVFDPYLNHFTDWSQPRVWNGAVQWEAGRVVPGNFGAGC